MDGYKSCYLWITILCLLQDYGSCSNIIDGPKNLTVLSGSNASFRCIVAKGWTSVSWYFQNTFVVSITQSQTTVSVNYITVQNSENPVTGDLTSEITIVNVNKTDSGIVSCSSLSSTFQEAYLSVQVSGSLQITNGSVTVTPNSTTIMICQAAQWYPAPTITWQINNTLADTLYYSTIYNKDGNDFVTALSTFRINPSENLSLTCLASIETLTQPQSATVNIVVSEHIPGNNSSLSRTDIILIAVFASLGGLLLLILIIVLIIYCCKRKKRKKTERGYQSDAWVAPERNSNHLRTVDRNGLGEHNFAYSPDPAPVRQNFGSINESNYDVESTSSIASTVQVPDPRWRDDHLRKIRHVTHV
ncbi:immunoglobulin superfamily member 5 [Leptodactylus fuscus]|uniref:immunoglobulin superfamily member 5 n=1 Tax=Leptodactylus fuscus TaxID=238119 RepID=UPI003F4EB396